MQVQGLLGGPAEHCNWTDVLTPHHSDANYIFPDQDAATTVFLAFSFAFSIFIIVGNSLVLVALAVFRELRTSTNLYLGSLAVADLSAGLTLIVTNGFTIKGVASDYVPCVYSMSASYICLGVSCFTLLGVSFDRWMAVCLPFRYKEIMTHKNVGLSVCFVWLYVTCLVAPVVAVFNRWGCPTDCCIPRMLHAAFAITADLHILIVIVLVTGLYIHMYVMVRKEKKAMAYLASGHLPSQRKVCLQLAKNVAIIVFIFFASFLPFSILDLYIWSLSAQDSLHSNPILCFDTLVTIQSYTLLPLFLNCGLNPVFYALRMPPMRKAFSRLLRNQCKTPSPLNANQ